MRSFARSFSIGQLCDQMLQGAVFLLYHIIAGDFLELAETQSL